MMYIPDHTVAEILVRSPVKSLKKFQSVCKGWRDLIKSPDFIHLYADHPSRKKPSTDYMIIAKEEHDSHDNFVSCYSRAQGGGLVRVTAPPNFPPISFPASFQRPRAKHVFGPCNGIIGLVVRYGGRFCRQEVIFLSNPATGESRILPDHTPDDDEIKYAHCYGTYACGLGLDPSTKEFKVFSALFYAFCDSDEDKYVPSSGVYRMGIYNLSSDTWKQVELDLPDTMRVMEGSSTCWGEWRGSGVLVKGRLHWLMEMETIMYFDISNEITGHLIYLPESEKKDGGTSLVLLEDSLALVVVLSQLENEETCSVVIWKMVDYGASESWMKRFSLSFPNSGTYRYPKPIVCWNNDMLLLGNGSRGVLVSVDLVENDDCQTKTYKLAGDDLEEDDLNEEDYQSSGYYFRETKRIKLMEDDQSWFVVGAVTVW